MSSGRFRIAVVAGLLLLLALVNFTIWQRETLLRDGRVVLLELAPVDPRSLMQGDYMALRFDVARKLQSLPAGAEAGTDGYVVVTVDARGVGAYPRVDVPDQALAADEVRIRFRQRKTGVRIVTNAWFFQEGSAAVYSPARYGELRVSAGGEALLTGLRDRDFKLLSAPPRS